MLAEINVGWEILWNARSSYVTDNPRSLKKMLIHFVFKKHVLNPTLDFSY